MQVLAELAVVWYVAHSHRSAFPILCYISNTLDLPLWAPHSPVLPPLAAASSLALFTTVMRFSLGFGVLHGGDALPASALARVLVLSFGPSLGIFGLCTQKYRMNCGSASMADVLHTH